MKILNIVQDTIVDGVGLRTTIYFAKCEHRCEGCHNPQSWNISNGIERTVQDIVQEIASNKIIKGVTLSGGDPLFQPKEACELSKQLKQLGYNIWVYTGFTYEEIINGENKDRIELLNYVDVLVDGKFIESEKDLTLKFRGSKNQLLIDLKESLKQSKKILFSI